jgi:hypothetical protein
MQNALKLPTPANDDLQDWIPGERAQTSISTDLARSVIPSNMQSYQDLAAIAAELHSTLHTVEARWHSHHTALGKLPSQRHKRALQLGTAALFNMAGVMTVPVANGTFNLPLLALVLLSHTTVFATAMLAAHAAQKHRRPKSIQQSRRRGPRLRQLSFAGLAAAALGGSCLGLFLAYDVSAPGLALLIANFGFSWLLAFLPHLPESERQRRKLALSTAATQHSQLQEELAATLAKLDANHHQRMLVYRDNARAK